MIKEEKEVFMDVNSRFRSIKTEVVAIKQKLEDQSRQKKTIQRTLMADGEALQTKTEALNQETEDLKRQVRER
jgi:predicted  nucleic acid-binding Zn-ribbon protein